jgi:tetratricopeptide (TPR) repeat protein
VNRGRHRAGVFVLSLVLSAAWPLPAEDYGPDVETYRSLIGDYCHGDREQALRVVGSWGPIWIESTTGRLLHALEDTAGTNVQAGQGAFLLHTHAALVGHELGLRGPDHEEHVEAALEFLRWFRDRYDDDPGSWPLEARGLSPRDFYLALASAELLVARFDIARELAEESLWGQKDDPEMRLLLGCAEEMEALIDRQAEGRWSDERLRRAEHRFRQALDGDPGLHEARLRLAWVLARRGQPERALPLLEAVARTPGDESRGSLAWLFLGKVREELQEPAAAIEAYRRAIDLAPHGQAAHVALAHAVEERYGEAAARAIVQPYFLERTRSWSRHDPWNDYPFGPPEMRLRPFEALRQRLCGR